MEKSYKINLIDEFKYYYPKQCENIKSFKIIGNFEVVSINEDGSVVSFYLLDKSIKYYTSKEDCCLDFGRRLRRLMDFKGLYSYQLAERAGISEKMISGYLNGVNEPTLGKIYKICKALNCEANELLIKI